MSCRHRCAGKGRTWLIPGPAARVEPGDRRDAAQQEWGRSGARDPLWVSCSCVQYQKHGATRLARGGRWNWKRLSEGPPWQPGRHCTWVGRRQTNAAGEPLGPCVPPISHHPSPVCDSEHTSRLSSKITFQNLVPGRGLVSSRVHPAQWHAKCFYPVRGFVRAAPRPQPWLCIPSWNLTALVSPGHSPRRCTRGGKMTQPGVLHQLWKITSKEVAFTLISCFFVFFQKT